MSNWKPVKGIVREGHGVASGKSDDPRFVKGTIAMQKPLFLEKGLDLDPYFSGTINVSIYPHKYSIKKSKYTFRNVKWSPREPSEDFSFFDCRVILDNDLRLEGLIYYPHPETKPEHFQDSDVLEIITRFIDGLKYGDEITIEINQVQLDISDLSEDITRSPIV